MADRVGQQLGNYHLIRLLGQGNFSEVYLGEHVHLKTQAAVKVLRERLAHHDIADFLKEARAIAHLRHPHVVQVLDFGIEGATPFLVMDYAPNGNLRQHYLRGTQNPLDALLAHLMPIADALQYAHEEMLIHRDVKPENMLLGRNNEVLLSDFGIAIMIQSSRQVPDTAGTIAYMAPEQLRGKPDPASDQYALGVVVYEWLCGVRPFHGTFAELSSQHLFASPPPLHEKVPSISSTVEHIVLKALAKEPEERFASVRDFAAALEDACKTESSGRTLSVLTSDFPEKHSYETKPTIDPLHVRLQNLPGPLTPLIGREQETQALKTLLQQPEVRLVTLTGTGGVGKTRLSLQMATELLHTFTDGICFVSLAPISDPDLVVPTIAQSLGVNEAGEQPLIHLLQTYLQDKQLLLLLDNFEQVVTAAPQLSDILASCPQLKILVSSRAVLRIRVEHEFPVLPLALPDLTRLPEDEALSQYAAVALFLRCAKAVSPGFHMTPANNRAIAEICVRLDGLPLAIELAAARIKLLPPQALLTRLTRRLQVLTGGARDAPIRQQTLRSTLAWSYDLLDVREQRLFRRLSVFVRGCTLDAIEGLYTVLGEMPADVLDGVASLMDKSLLRQVEQDEQEPRLLMLATIREYGWEVLEASGEMETIRRAHAEYYLRLSEQAELELGGPQQGAWLERLEQEHDNLRAALQWAVEEAEKETGQHSEVALRLGGALYMFWWSHGHWSEGRTFLERALKGSKGTTPPVQAKALYVTSSLSFIQSHYERAEALSSESLILYRELGDQRGIALSLWVLGNIAWVRSNPAQARSLLEEALALFKEVDDKEYAAYSLFSLALSASSQGQYARACALFEESLAFSREIGYKQGIAHTLSQLAQALFVSQGDQARVRSLLDECLTLSREIGFKEGIAASLLYLGQLALSQGDSTTARSLAEESVVLYKEMGHRHGIAESLGVSGKVVASLGDFITARKLYEESLTLSGELGEKWAIASCLVGLGEVVAAQRHLAWAVQLWGAADALRDTLGITIPPVELADYERSLSQVRVHLGERAFTAAWMQGRAMTPEQALAAQGKKQTSSPTTNVSPSPSYPAGLTAREVEVLRLVAEGLTDMQIAEKLVLSPRTVHAHTSSIYNKLAVTSRSAATRYALEHHLA